MNLMPTRREIWVAAGIAIATLVVYLPVRNFEFVNYDDDLYVTNRPEVQAGLSWEGVRWAFTTRESCNWHPITWLSHMLDCELFGLDAGIQHVVNLLLHTLNAILLFLTFQRMTGKLWRSGFVAALFALHPLHVESVAWVSERKDVLSTSFGLLALWSYSGYVKQPVRRRYVGSLVFFALSLLAKPMLVTLPFVMLLLDYWPLRRSGWMSLVREKLPFFGLTVVSSVITFWAQHTGGVVVSIDRLPVWVRLCNAVVAYVWYAAKAIWPSNLALLYPYASAHLTWQASAAAVLVIMVTALVWRASSSHPHLLVGWLWYVGTLVPVIGLVQVGLQSVADRYSYIPLTGLFVMASWAVPESLCAGRWRQVLGLGASALIGVFAMVTWVQVGVWQDSISLFRHALRVTKPTELIHANLGMALFHAGQHEQGIAHLEESLRLNPQYATAHNNLGVAYAKLGRADEALAQYREAVRFGPQQASNHNNLGVALVRSGNPTEGILHFRAAVRLRPSFAEAHNNLGAALMDQGHLHEALAEYIEAIRLKPGYAEAHKNLGVACVKVGHLADAVAHLDKATQLHPGYGEAYAELGVALMIQGRLVEAIRALADAVRIRPGDATVHNNLGFALSKAGRQVEAISEFAKAIQLNPAYPQAQNNLGFALGMQGKLREAIPHFMEAVRLKRDYAEAYYNWAVALAQLGQRDEARLYFQKALDLDPEMTPARDALERLR